MDFCWPGNLHGIDELMHVTTPLDADIWEAVLVPHPDRAYVNYVVQGLHGVLGLASSGEPPVLVPPASRDPVYDSPQQSPAKQTLPGGNSCSYLSHSLQ